MSSHILHERRLVLPFLAPLYGSLSPLMEPMVRAAAGLLLVPHGAQKLFGAFGGGGLAGSGQFLESIGYAPGFLWALALGGLEFFGGILLALGLFTRPVAAAVALFMLQAVLFHASNGYFWPDGGFEYPLFWGIVALSFAVRGGGPYSLDAKLGREL
jgi:putative oxidoreductase